MDIPAFIKKNQALSLHCTLKIGGGAKYFVEPINEEEIVQAVRWAISNGLSYFVIGRGSNILFADEGYSGLIIKISKKLSRIIVNNEQGIVSVQAGAWMPHVARKCQSHGLSGLEHAVGIPGNIGGIITMNAGSQRKSISSNLQFVRYVDENGNVKTLNVNEGEFGYRKSTFQNNKWIILEATFFCELGDKNEIRRTMLEILGERRRKFPRKLPNCGSVFKSNPSMYKSYGPPGKIIEDMGLKGTRFGGVFVSEKHANFFINENGTSKDFSQLLCFVKEKAKAEYGIDLHEEVIFVK